MAAVGVASAHMPKMPGSLGLLPSHPAPCQAFLPRIASHAACVSNAQIELELCIAALGRSNSGRSATTGLRRVSSPRNQSQRQRLTRVVATASLAAAPVTAAKVESQNVISTAQEEQKRVVLPTNESSENLLRIRHAIFYNSLIQGVRDGKTFNFHQGLMTSMAVVMSSLVVTSPAFALGAMTDGEWIQFWIGWLVFAFLYFLVIPLVLYNYLRLRWYKRKLPEAILQYGLVFVFFPGLLLWAPFINFRRMPRNNAKEPWDDPRSL